MDKQFDWRETPMTDEKHYIRMAEEEDLIEDYDAMRNHAEHLERALRHLAYRSSIYCEQDECCARRFKAVKEHGAGYANKDCIVCQADKAMEATK